MKIRPSLAPSVLTLAALSGSPLLAQDSLLKDIHPDQALASGLDSDPGLIADVPGGFLMTLRSNPFGRELWFSDGTGAGTTRISDLGIGNDWGDPYDVEELPDGSLLLAAGSTAWGGELFRLDPLTLEIELVRDINPGTASSSLAGFELWQGEAWFYANTATDGRQIWRSDGTPGGTVQPFVLNPASGISNGTDRLKATPTTLYFTTTKPTRALYALNDPNGSPVLLAEGEEIEFGAGSDFSMLASLGNQLLFNFDDGVHGQELWITDGTLAGTSLFLDFLPGPASSSPTLVASNGSNVWFSAVRAGQGREISRTDGSVAGTIDMDEIVPGTGDGISIYSSGLLRPEGIYLQGSSLGFFGPFSGPLVLSLTGTTFESLLPGLSGALFTEHAGEVYFDGFQGQFNSPVYRTDGTAQGTEVAFSIPGDPILNLLGSTPFGLLFSFDDAQFGFEPHLFDPGTGQVAKIGDFSGSLVGSSSQFGAGVTFLGQHYFGALEPTTGTEAWSTDGTSAGTQLEQDLLPGPLSSAFRPLLALGSQLLYQVRSENGGPYELWAAGSSLSNPQNLSLGAGQPGGLTVYAVQRSGATAFLLANDSTGILRVWRSDGSIEETEVIFPPPGSSVWIENDASRFAVAGETLWFVADDGTHGSELWKSDGTEAGTELAFDLNPGSGSSFPRDLTTFGDQLFFSADVPGTGREAYAVAADGSLTFLGDIRPGSFGCIPAEPVSLDDRLIFFANDGSFGQEAFVTDGTLPGTFRLGDLSPFFFGFSTERYPVRAGDYVFFFVPHTGDSFALWRSAGTIESTQEVVGFLPDGPGLQRQELTPLGSANAVVFRQYDVARGEELWTATSEPESLQFAVDIWPGFDNSSPIYTGRVGDRLIFAAERELEGREPHALSLTNLGGFVAEPFGSACGNAHVDTAGEVRLLEPFEILLEADPFLGATLGFSTQQDFIPLGDGCGFRLPLNFQNLAQVVTDGSGEASAPFFVPNNPAFVGLPFYVQWLVFNPGGEILDLIDLSEGLELILGS